MITPNSLFCAYDNFKSAEQWLEDEKAALKPYAEIQNSIIRQVLTELKLQHESHYQHHFSFTNIEIDVDAYEELKVLCAYGFQGYTYGGFYLSPLVLEGRNEEYAEEYKKSCLNDAREVMQNRNKEMVRRIQCLQDEIDELRQEMSNNASL